MSTATFKLSSGPIHLNIEKEFNTAPSDRPVFKQIQTFRRVDKKNKSVLFIIYKIKTVNNLLLPEITFIDLSIVYAK